MEAEKAHNPRILGELAQEGQGQEGSPILFRGRGNLPRGPCFPRIPPLPRGGIRMPDGPCGRRGINRRGVDLPAKGQGYGDMAQGMRGP